MNFKNFLVSLALGSAMFSGAFSAEKSADKELANVDGVKITAHDFDFLSEQFPDSDFSKLSADQKSNLINQRINIVLMERDAKAKGLDKTQTYIDQVAALKSNVLVGLWQQEIAKESAKTAIPDANIQAYYDAHPNEFTQQEGHLRHILVRTKEEAQKIINELVKIDSKRLQTAFIEQAKKHSQDPGTKDNGGDLGKLSRSNLVPEFANAGFALNPNSITRTPVKTQFGYHVIYLLEKTEPKKTSFADAKAGIENIFRSRNAQELVQKRIQTLRDGAKIIIK